MKSKKCSGQPPWEPNFFYAVNRVPLSLDSNLHTISSRADGCGQGFVKVPKVLFSVSLALWGESIIEDGITSTRWTQAHQDTDHPLSLFVDRHFCQLFRGCNCCSKPSNCILLVIKMKGEVYSLHSWNMVSWMSTIEVQRYQMMGW